MATTPSKTSKANYQVAQPTKQYTIETSPKAAERAQIVRDGLAVADVELNSNKIAGILVGYQPVVSRVVSQSVAPGTAIARGTAINLIMTLPVRVPANVIDGIHPGMASENMQSLFDKYLKDDPELVNIVANAAGGKQVSGADQAKVQAKLQSKGVAMGNSPGQDVNAAMLGLNAAYTFNG